MYCKITNCIPCKIFKTYQRNIDNNPCPICSRKLIRGYDGYYWSCEASESHYIEVGTFDYNKKVDQIYIGFPKLFDFNGKNSNILMFKHRKTISFMLNGKVILDNLHDPKLLHWDKIDTLEEQIAKLVVFT